MTSCLVNWHRPLLLVFIFALIIRGIFVLTLQNGFYFPDSLAYSQTALNLVTAGEFGANYDRAPGYPVFLAGLHLLFGESIVAIRLSESLMGAFLAVIIAGLGRRLGGEIVGIAAGLMWAVYPLGIFVAGLVYPTGLCAMFLVCAVWFILPPAGDELSAKGVLLSGFFLGLAALTIPVALLTIVVVVGWVFYWASQSRLLLVSLLILGSAASLAPWTARNFMVHDKLVPVQVSFEEQLPRIVAAGEPVPAGNIAAISRRPGLYTRHVVKNFLQFWEMYPTAIMMSNPHLRRELHTQDSRVVQETIYTPSLLVNTISVLSTGPVFFFALFGTVAIWLNRNLRRALSLLWLITLSFAVGYAFFHGKIRYRIPVEPFLIMLSAYGVNLAYAKIVGRVNGALPTTGPGTPRLSAELKQRTAKS